MALLIFSLFCVASILVLRSNRCYEYAVINLAPLTRFGLDGQCTGSFVKADIVGKVNPHWFHSRTLILGYDQECGRGPAAATFSFPLPRNIFRRGVEVTASLAIEAERVHGGLHSHLGPKQKKAAIEANGQLIDEFWLIDRMPNGEDYGYHNFGPIPITNSFLTGPTLEATLRIEDQMAWDIDRVVLQISTGSHRLTVTGSMVAGALISAAAGLLPAAFETLRAFFT